MIYLFYSNLTESVMIILKKIHQKFLIISSLYVPFDKLF